jgi:hypothetical protein
MQNNYCNWGLGPKPVSGCPTKCNALKDCDDANAAVKSTCV